MAKPTKTQRFILQCLDAPGHVPEPKGRYTLSLRILEERGLVGHSMSHGWYIKQAGRAVLEEVTMTEFVAKSPLLMNAADVTALQHDVHRLTRERDDLLTFAHDLERHCLNHAGLKGIQHTEEGQELRARLQCIVANADKETGG